MEKQFVQRVRHIFSLFMSHRTTFVKCSRTQFDYAMFSLFTQKSIFLLQLLLLFATAADLLFVLFLFSSYTWVFRAIWFRCVWCFLFSSMHQYQTWKIIFRATAECVCMCVYVRAQHTYRSKYLLLFYIHIRKGCFSHYSLFGSQCNDFTNHFRWHSISNQFN